MGSPGGHKKKVGKRSLGGEETKKVLWNCSSKGPYNSLGLGAPSHWTISSVAKRLNRCPHAHDFTIIDIHTKYWAAVNHARDGCDWVLGAFSS